MRPVIVRCPSLLSATAWLALIAGCTSAYEGSGPSPEDDGGGPDTDSDTGTLAQIHPWLPSGEELVPDLSLHWAKATVGGPLRVAIVSLAATGADTFVAGGHIHMWSIGGSAQIMFDDFAVPATAENSFWVKHHVSGEVLWASWAGDKLSTVQVFDVQSNESGRIATCGNCDNGARFGQGEPNDTEVLTGHPYPMARWTSYFAVFEEDGSLAWVRSFLIPALDSRSFCMSVELLDDGSVLAAGYFAFGAVAGAGTSTETILLRHPAVETTTLNRYLAKYDPDGNLLWARREGGPGSGIGHIGLTSLADGSFFLSGIFSGTTVLGEGQVNETTLVSAGESSVFLARYDPDGDLEWAVDLGIDGNSVAIAPTAKPLVLVGGDVVIHGTFMGSMPAGDGDALEPVFLQDEGGGVFLSRYTDEGEHVWTRVATTDILGHRYLWGSVELHDGSLVFSGSFSESLTFEPGKPTERTLHATGELDGFLASYCSRGDLLWVLHQGGTGGNTFWSLLRLPLDTPDSDMLIVSGGTTGTTTFGTGPDDEVTLTNDTEDFDGLLLRFDREGQ